MLTGGEMNKRYARILFFILLLLFIGTLATQFSPALKQDFFQGSNWENGYALITNILILLSVFDYAYDKKILPRPLIFAIMLNTFGSVCIGIGMTLFNEWAITTGGEVITILLLAIAIYGSALAAMYALSRERSTMRV